MNQAQPDGPWRPSIDRTHGPLYLAIADVMQSDILAGRLRGGDRLPPQRQLAEHLDIDFTTVTRAYAEARRRGLVEGQVGRGTYVRQATPARTQLSRGQVDLSMIMPPRFDDAAVVARMCRGMAELQTGDVLGLLLRYQEAGGTEHDRMAGARWLARRLDGAPENRLLVCAGVQGALEIVLNMLAAPGDAICVEALSYSGFLSLAAHQGVRLLPIPMDDQGLQPEAFEAACKTQRPKALYCNPTLHNPTTVTMPLARRKMLIDIARRYHVPIIEDDAHGALPLYPEPALARLGPDIVYYIAGLAKCLSPALRIAYLVLPDPRQFNGAIHAMRGTAAVASPLTAALATQWIEDGTADAVLEAIRREVGLRQSLVAEILPAGTFQADPCGSLVWLNLPHPWTRREFVASMRAEAIGVVGSDAFSTGMPPEAVRLGVGVAADHDELARSLHRVAYLLAHPPAATTMVV